MSEYQYNDILKFIEVYGGRQYRQLSKCKSEEEYRVMEAGSKSGKAARKGFTEIADYIATKTRLNRGTITQWQNSGTFVSYFWCQLKLPEYDTSSISLSIFAETGREEPPSYRFRVSVEIADERASEVEKMAYRTILDVPLKEGLHYISGGNNNKEFEIVDKNEIETKKKIQVSYIVNKTELTDNEALLDSLCYGSELLMDYYKHALGGTEIPEKGTKRDGKAWLLTWNPANYEWTNYEQEQRMLQNGETVINAWACQNTHVQSGDRVYMMLIGAGKKNGIIASGIAKGESYTAEHWDAAKAAAGKTTSKIDVAFDIMVDPYGEYVLNQEELREEFPGQKWSPQASGITIKEEYVKDLERVWLEKTSGKETDKYMELTAKEAIQRIKDYIKAKGFTYEDDLIENFYLSLKSKPFVILAGTSGTGKTKLVELFADAIGAEPFIVSVRPDWSDSNDLFGYTNLNGEFNDGPVCKAFNTANKFPQKPVLLCLDEMNLSRVEYYLSDFLSIIETRKRKAGKIVTSAIAQYEDGIPDNLYLIGTVNMDETTFPFSKKVLDRANTIEFNYVDLLPQAGHITEECSAMDLPNSFLHTDYLILNDCMDDEEFVREICTELQSLNQILVKANAHVGFRVRDEIVFYMMNNKNSGELLSYEQAMDNEILQKVLPRIQGSSAAIKSLLIELYQFCMGNDFGIDSETGSAGEYMKSNASAARYPLSAQKLGYMMARYEDDGFTSYWL